MTGIGVKGRIRARSTIIDELDPWYMHKSKCRIEEQRVELERELVRIDNGEYAEPEYIPYKSDKELRAAGETLRTWFRIRKWERAEIFRTIPVEQHEAVRLYTVRNMPTAWPPKCKELVLTARKQEIDAERLKSRNRKALILQTLDAFNRQEVAREETEKYEKWLAKAALITQEAENRLAFLPPEIKAVFARCGYQL